MTGRKSAHTVNVTKIRCTLCMKKFGQRQLIKFQGAYYHEECFDTVTHKHKRYGGKKMTEKKPSMRQV
jgi:hypothetical protein